MNQGYLTKAHQNLRLVAGTSENVQCLFRDHRFFQFNLWRLPGECVSLFVDNPVFFSATCFCGFPILSHFASHFFNSVSPMRQFCVCKLHDFSVLQTEVELRGFEPLSKRGSHKLSTCLSPDLFFE